MSYTRFIFFVIFLGAAFAAAAQEEENCCDTLEVVDTLLEADVDGVSYGIRVAPNISKITGYKTGEDYKLSTLYTAEVRLRLSERLWGGLGAQFINTGLERDVEGSGDPEVERVIYQENYNYLGLPLHFRYRLGKRAGKADWNLAGGITPAFNLGNERRIIRHRGDGGQEVVLEEITIPQGQIRNFNLVVEAGLGVNVDVTPIIRVTVEPIAYYSLISMFKDADRSGHFYGFGMQIGLWMN